MQLDEETAVVLSNASDEGSFRALVERHSRTIFRLAFRMTGNEQDAEDVVQETFMQAYKQISQFEKRADFGTWLYRIGVNCACDYIRARERHSGQESIDGATSKAPLALRAPDPLPDRIVLSREVQVRVGEALAELTPKERAAFVLRHFEGCGIEEIARILEVRSNAAKHTVFRAVKKLRRALAPLVDLTI